MQLLNISVICLDRVGSEFWNQQVRIGNDLTGIKWVAFEIILFDNKDVFEIGYSTVLTQSEKGLPPEFEFVGVPSMIRNEKGEF